MSSSLHESFKKILENYMVPRIEWHEISIISEIDPGATSKIEKAKWKGKIVALKSQRLEYSRKNRDAYRPFIAEVKLLTQVTDNTHVIKLHGYTCKNSLYYMILEYVEGGNLRDYLKTNPHLEFPRILEIALELTRGLKALHDVEILHRDLHTKNVLLTKEGRVKIAKLGLAKRSNSVRSSIYGGMIAFLEPELFINGIYKRTSASDVYSLGTLLWVLTSGEDPFTREASHPIHIVLKLCGNKRESPIIGTPLLYVQLYQACWQADPKERPSLQLVDHILSCLRNKEPRPVYTPAISFRTLENLSETPEFSEYMMRNHHPAEDHDLQAYPQKKSIFRSWKKAVRRFRRFFSAKSH